MFNPFCPFTQPLLEAFVKRGRRYFVRQTFSRGKDHFEKEIKGCFLFSPYDHLTTAQDHLGAITFDPNRFLYDWSQPEHQARLRVAAGGLKDYRIFTNIFHNDWERHLTPRIHEKVRMYVQQLGWRPKGEEKVDTNFEVQFGELFIRLKLANREAKVKFEEIEKIF